MNKRALILDLDNTIYPTASMGMDFFDGLFDLLKESGGQEDNIEKIKGDIMSKPFQVIADKYHFTEDLKKKGMELLSTLKYEGTLLTYPDYEELELLPADKFLVTAGFRQLQESKIRSLGIVEDFIEIIIVDQSVSPGTKKDAFTGIMQRYNYQPHEVLVIGDDPESEIKAARELSIDAILYDRYNRYAGNGKFRRIADFKELKEMIAAA